MATSTPGRAGRAPAAPPASRPGCSSPTSRTSRLSGAFSHAKGAPPRRGRSVALDQEPAHGPVPEPPPNPFGGAPHPALEPGQARTPTRRRHRRYRSSPRAASVDGPARRTPRGRGPVRAAGHPLRCPAAGRTIGIRSGTPHPLLRRRGASPGCPFGTAGEVRSSLKPDGATKLIEDRDGDASSPTRRKHRARLLPRACGGSTRHPARTPVWIPGNERDADDGPLPGARHSRPYAVLESE
jgi:hypothetical protein